MKKELQRIKIAEACGWIIPDQSRVAGNPETPFWWEYYRNTFSKIPECASTIWGIPPNNETPNGNVLRVPDYLNSLDAMHEAEKVLTLGQYGNYRYLLIDMSASRYASATAAQRAEAFLRTIGKWEDGE